MSSAKLPATISGAYHLHKRGITGKNITIAVMDSGLAPHPDFEKNRILAFRDFVAEATTPYDDYAHGTHVTGILSSSVIGVAPESGIVSLKVLDRYGNGSSDIFIRAIQWLLKHQQTYNIRICNISIGGNTPELRKEQNPLNFWVERLWAAGVIVCCSAGNNGPRPDSITAPGNCRKVITVGSYDGKHFSSAGPLLPYITKPELVAPGYRILGTKPGGGYSVKNGTSMSVPFISGACALLLQNKPHLTNDQVKIRLMEASHTVPWLPYNMQGAGILNLEQLLSLS